MGWFLTVTIQCSKLGVLACLVIAALLPTGAINAADGEVAESLTVRFLDLEDVDDVWIGVVGDDPDEANWTLSKSQEIELALPNSEHTMLLVLAKDRQAKVVKLSRNTETKPIEIRLSRGFTMSGTIRSEDGRPLSNAQVTVAPAQIEGVEIPSYAKPSWMSLQGGEFSIGGLSNSRYRVEATADGYVPYQLDDVSLRDGHTKSFEIELPVGNFVTGHVVDQYGTLVQEANIRTYWAERRHAVVEHRGVIRGKLSRDHGHHKRNGEVKTDERGAFRVGPVEAGTIVNIHTGSKGAGISWDNDVVAPYENLILRFRHHQERVRGAVLDANTGEPVESFTLTTYSGSGAARSENPIRADDGKFDVTIRAATHSVSVEATGYAPWLGRLYPAKSRENDIGEIHLQHARSVRGQVRDATTGEPIAGVSIKRSDRQFNDLHLKKVFSNWFTQWPGVKSDVRGNYEIGGISPNSYQLVVSQSKVGRQLVSLPADITHFDIHLSVDSIIAGVLSLPDETPAQGHVRLTGQGISRVQNSVADGSFRFEHLSPGTYRFNAHLDNGALSRQEFVVAPEERLENIQLEVEPGWQVSGQVMGLVGPEIVHVSVQNEKGKTVHDYEFGNGPYILRGVPRKASILSQTSTNRFLARRVNFSGNEEFKLDLDYRGTSQLTGVVTTAGLPVGGIELVAFPRNRKSPGATAKTTETGQYSMKGLLNGQHLVRTLTGHSFKIDVTGHSVLDMELPPVSLTGVVRASTTGTPVRSGAAGLRRNNSADGDSVPTQYAQILNDGRFEFEGLLSGSYTLRISHPEFDSFSQRVQIDGTESIEVLLECENKDCGQFR